MALINCPECGVRTSKAASACPGCGHPIKRGMSCLGRLVTYTLIAGTLIVGLMVYAAINSSRDRTPAPVQPQFTTKSRPKQAPAILLPTHKILKEEPNNVLKRCNLTIELPERISEEDLKELSKSLRASRPQFERVWIFYHIQGERNSSAWAYTHFMPEFDMEIVGSTIEQEKTLKDLPKPEGEIIGRWKVNLGAEMVFTITKDGNKYSKETRLQSGESFSNPIYKEIHNGKTVFDTKNRHGEYIVIEENGDLSLWNSERKYGTAKKMELSK